MTEVKKGIHFHIMTKKDIEKELAQTKTLFGMSPEEFYEAWKKGDFHGFEAMKLGCLYEIYMDEYT